MTFGAWIEPERVRSNEPTAAIAPLGSSGERDFLAERLALFGRIACLASSAFLLMRLVLNGLARQSVAREAVLLRFPIFHPVATAILLLIWMLAGRRALTDKGLRRLDAAGTIAASFAFALMESRIVATWGQSCVVVLRVLPA